MITIHLSQCKVIGLESYLDTKDAPQHVCDWSWSNKNSHALFCRTSEHLCPTWHELGRVGQVRETEDMIVLNV